MKPLFAEPFSMLRAACAGAGLVLSACATAPAPVPVPVADEVPESVADLISPFIIPVTGLTPRDPGLVVLASAVSGERLISFMSGNEHSLESMQLKSALTQTLIERHDLGLVILDAPCRDVEALDAYAGGAATGALAEDVVDASGLPPELKSAPLADLLTMMRGWNAIHGEAPVRISGKRCNTAREVQADRPAIFWGLAELPASMEEKALAAASRDGEPAERHALITQLSGPPLDAFMTGSGWVDTRTLPEHPLLSDWRAAQAAATPALAKDHPWSAEIVFQHGVLTPRP